VSFQFRINNKTELKAIDISFVKQFAVPVFLLVVLTLVLSLYLERFSDEAHVWQGADSSSSEAVSRLQRQIAELEGESQRLKVFAKKMVTLAKLDKNIFSFDEPPARGGLGGRNIFRRNPDEMAETVRKDIKGLQKQLIQQSNQFERMQLVLRSREIGKSLEISKWPVASGYLSSAFGMRKDPFNGRLRKHNGIDLAGPKGSDIMSVAAGTVIFSGRKGGYGRVIDIKHANGLVSRYAHLQKSLVKVNQIIVAGEKIALLGTSGRSTGPHLHLEILKNNKNIDPLVFLGSPK
jgi:murein DD-endopeptidase MepM/ murein hydrolase activator NlpD